MNWNVANKARVKLPEDGSISRLQTGNKTFILYFLLHVLLLQAFPFVA